jgi:hypothetical protein
VEFNKGLLHPEKGVHQHQPSSLTGQQKKAFDPSAAVRWQRMISPIDKWLITALTKRSMKILDYHPDTHPIFRGEQQAERRLCEEVAC